MKKPVNLGLFIALVLIVLLLGIPSFKILQVDNMLEQSALDCHTKTIGNNVINKTLLLHTLDRVDKGKTIFLKDVREEDDQILVETIYDSDELEECFVAEGINSVEDFNNFINDTDFEPVPVCYSPTDLFTSHKGNCYAYTLFTMFYLSKYHPELTYEPVFEYYENGESHVYLLIKNKKNQVICDLTKNKELVLPE